MRTHLAISVAADGKHGPPEAVSGGTPVQNVEPVPAQRFSDNPDREPLWRPPEQQEGDVGVPQRSGQVGDLLLLMPRRDGFDHRARRVLLTKVLINEVLITEVLIPRADDRPAGQQRREGVGGGSQHDDLRRAPRVGAMAGHHVSNGHLATLRVIVHGTEHYVDAPDGDRLPPGNHDTQP